MLIEHQCMDLSCKNTETTSNSFLDVFKNFSNIFNEESYYLTKKDFKDNNDFFCYSCIHGIINNIDELIDSGVNPFIFNIKYKTNPFHLAVINNHHNIIDKIKYYVDIGYIKYDHDFYCPSWSLRYFKKGTCNYQFCLFQGFNNEIISAFWNDDIKKWIEF